MSTNTGSDRRTGPETRAEILRVALRLFTEKGYEGTSTRDISSALGMTKSSLYYHFQNKEEIVASLVEGRRHELDDFIEWLAAQPPTPDRLEKAALRWLQGTTPEHLQAMLFAQANQPVMRRLAEGGRDIRSNFDRVIDLLVDEGASMEDRLLTRMVFDTAGAALLSARGTEADPDDVIAAARRATTALARATTEATKEAL
ncbi:TetR/AcrR family transcriptional regulator [Nonomuraea sp. NEAU-A123]|uniref:TetR/AcrR family transcriptional regulator n=1 Tax=Nonomuraea sp. NEAU-A123 TaxID=2839649 RepID=UPI001BE3E1DE|nr:TetR/AcrR family transcriptional regulator [Nonomuraea sp. NEAU-A123]MBT2226585.1 TetR/AcrR family transcriptional regulator [Nonomuraea sp. NEAU-A123]